MSNIQGIAGQFPQKIPHKRAFFIAYLATPDLAVVLSLFSVFIISFFFLGTCRHSYFKRSSLARTHEKKHIWAHVDLGWGCQILYAKEYQSWGVTTTGLHSNEIHWMHSTLPNGRHYCHRHCQCHSSNIENSCRNAHTHTLKTIVCMRACVCAGGNMHGDT